MRCNHAVPCAGVILECCLPAGHLGDHEARTRDGRFGWADGVWDNRTGWPRVRQLL